MTIRNRRVFLASLAAMLPGTVLAGTKGSGSNRPAFRDCPGTSGGPNAFRFPKAVVQDQRQRKAWFYEELIAGKLVLISFTSVQMERRYPVLANLTGVQTLLADRLGRDVFMYTLTTEPHRDGPEDLKRLAEAHGARWRFLTGEVLPMREILAAFNVRGRLSGLVWIGNERTGRWIKRPGRQAPSAIAEAVARLSVGERYRPFLVDRHSASPGVSKPEERNKLRHLSRTKTG